MDELLVQIDGDGRAGWVMQDAGGDVVALAVNAVSSTGGAANGSDAVAANGVLASATGTNLSFRIAAQQEYDAYGQVIWAEHLLNHAALHLGHKGLFVDRLDVGVGIGIGSGGNGNPGAAACAKTFGEPPRIVPLAFNLAQNRNRTLHTSWGRYLQQDPNASGMSVQRREDLLGSAVSAAPSPIDLNVTFVDGANLYCYGRSATYLRSDPLGLFSTAWMAPMAPGFATSILTNALWGAGVGAAMGAGVEAGVGLAEGEDWGSIGRRAKRGAIAGAAAGAAFEVASASAVGYIGSIVARNVISGSAAGFYGGVTSAWMSGGGVTTQISDGLWGAAFGGILGGGTGYIAQQAEQVASQSTASIVRYLTGSGGRLGGQATRLLNHGIATELESQGYNIVGGAGRFAEEWIPGPGGGKSGGTWVDITATNGRSKIRIQTVDTLADGITPTSRELAAAKRIRDAFPNDELRLIPKSKP